MKVTPKIILIAAGVALVACAVKLQSLSNTGQVVFAGLGIALIVAGIIALTVKK